MYHTVKNSLPRKKEGKSQQRELPRPSEKHENRKTLDLAIGANTNDIVQNSII